jgi:hypothetical protein
MMGHVRVPVINVLILFVVLTASALIAGAHYAVPRSGGWIHITGCEAAGDPMRLDVPGGTMELPIGTIASVEPENAFPANSAAPVNDGRYSTLIRAAALKHSIDEKLIEQVIATGSNIDPHAVSRKLATGLMQLLPGTAVRCSVVNVVLCPVCGLGTRTMRNHIPRA